MSIYDHDHDGTTAPQHVFTDIRDWRLGDRLYGYGHGWDGAVITRFTSYSIGDGHPEGIAVKVMRQNGASGLFAAADLRTMYVVRA